MGISPDVGAASTTAVARGRDALTRGAWEQARAAFEEAVADGEPPQALEGLSWAAWWLSDAATLFDVRERAYRRYRELGDARGAARMAMWLGTDHVDFRGEVAVGQGWLGRARRLLEGFAPGPEHGWLYVHEAEKRFHANDLPGARTLAHQAATLGRELARPEVEMLGLATEGLVLVASGAVDDGMPLLDEASAAALGGDIADLVAASWCCCYLIFACDLARDYDRAAQWCTRVAEWADREDIRFIHRSCRAHYGGVLVWRGDWPEAEAELTESARHLTVLRPPMAAEATVRLAELRRRQGRLAEAAELFEQVADHPLSLLGLGELCLDRDDPTGARDRAEQYLRALPADTRSARAGGLELLVRAASRLGDHAAAGTALAELEDMAGFVPTAPLRASVRHAAGAAAAATGDLEVARAAFEDATRLFHAAGAPFEAARARIDLAEVLARLDRPSDAVREARGAAVSLRRVGAEREAARAEQVAAAHTGAAHAGGPPVGVARAGTRSGDAAPNGGPVRPHRPAPATSPLTPREQEVLRLVADGLSDRDIAAHLVLSEHTVHRHVANILTKLGCSSRTAAVAAALRNHFI